MGSGKHPISAGCNREVPKKAHKAGQPRIDLEEDAFKQPGTYKLPMLIQKKAEERCREREREKGKRATER